MSGADTRHVGPAPTQNCLAKQSACVERGLAGTCDRCFATVTEREMPWALFVRCCVCVLRSRMRAEPAHREPDNQSAHCWSGVRGR